MEKRRKVRRPAAVYRQFQMIKFRLIANEEKARRQNEAEPPLLRRRGAAVRQSSELKEKRETSLFALHPVEPELILVPIPEMKIGLPIVLDIAGKEVLVSREEEKIDPRKKNP